MTVWFKNYKHFAVISIPPSGCNELKAACGGREICPAVVQQLNISTKARQISHSRKSDYTTIPVLLGRYNGTRIVISIPPPGCNELKASCGGREICPAIVQKLSIITQAQQISPSRKSDYTTISVLLVRYDGTRIVISIPPPGCNELKVYCGGREICPAVVQQLNISAKA